MATVSIDRPGCISCEVCWTVCPEVFQPNPEDMLSEIVQAFREGGDNSSGTIPDALKEGAQSAADQCPVSVIKVE
jgi:ferredoxin